MSGHRTFTTAVLLGALVSVGSGQALPQQPAVPRPTEAAVNKVFARWTTSTPGCAVGVAVGGKTVFTRAYGMADLEHDVPNTADTIFEAGSVAAARRRCTSPPGTQWSYTNTGFNLATIVVSRVSGMSFAEFSRTRIFAPLGMTRTSWRDDHTRVVKGRAIAYTSASDGYHLEMPFENVHGNGGPVQRWPAAGVRTEPVRRRLSRRTEHLSQRLDGRLSRPLPAMTPPPSAAQLAEFSGTYWSDEAEVAVTIAVEPGRLAVKRRPDSVIALTAIDRDTFRGSIGTVTFRRDTSGKVNELSVKQDRVWDLRFQRR